MIPLYVKRYFTQKARDDSGGGGKEGLVATMIVVALDGEG
jgi:hypothetical protein